LGISKRTVQNASSGTLQLGQNNSLLMLIFTLAIGIAHFANFVGLEEQDLAPTGCLVNTKEIEVQV